MNFKDLSFSNPLNVINRRFQAEAAFLNVPMNQFIKLSKEKENREIQQIDYLKSIKQNTDFPNGMHKILIENQNGQQEILDVLKQSLGDFKG